MCFACVDRTVKQRAMSILDVLSNDISRLKGDHQTHAIANGGGAIGILYLGIGDTAVS
jgi:hypothetical protein